MRSVMILVSVQSKAWVCSLSLAGIAGSDPAEGMGARLLCLLCAVLVAAFATNWPLVQRNPTGYVCVPNCVIINLTVMRPRHALSCSTTENICMINLST
jgi:hypothetical protein